MASEKQQPDQWAAPAEIHDFIEGYFCCSARVIVLELGSGSGSATLVNKSWVESVHSIEHDPEYVGKHPGVNYIHAPIVNGWYDTRVLREQLPEQYDVILVDGPPGAIGRGGLFSNLDLFDTTKPMVFDDVHRQPEQELIFKVARYLDNNYSIHVLRDGRAFGTIGFDLW